MAPEEGIVGAQLVPPHNELAVSIAKEASHISTCKPAPVMPLASRHLSPLLQANMCYTPCMPAGYFRSKGTGMAMGSGGHDRSQ